MVLSRKTWRDFKSPLRVIVNFLLKGRERSKREARRLREELRLSEQKVAALRQECEHREQEIGRLRQVAGKLELELRQTRRPIRLPDDPPVGSHGYGPRKICLAVNLARAVGLRGAERVLGIVFDWLEVEETVPDWTSIRGWMQRLGVDALNRPMEKADDWIWMADHSNQIGQEKVLVVLAVRASELPPPGTALTHDCMRVLHIQPGRSWKKGNTLAV